MQSTFLNFHRNLTGLHRVQLFILIGLCFILSLILTRPQPAHAAAVNCANTAATGVPQAECEALVALYNSTNGPGWKTKTNWNTAAVIDAWYGVTVSAGHVTELKLNSNQLSGNIPDLSALTSLRWLWLPANQLSGSIPDLSALTNLEQLYLYNNQLSGSIPDLSTLTNLAYLYLYNNQLSGSIPDLSGLTQLHYLYLYNNQLSGSIPDLSALTNLSALYLNNNQLSGSIPDLSALTNLVYLRLNNNQLVSIVPPSIIRTAIFQGGRLFLCGGSNIITSEDPVVISWVRPRDPSWTQGCGLLSEPMAVNDFYTTEAAGITVSSLGMLWNDALGAPAAGLVTFGGGSMGGAVTDHAAGTTVSPLPGYSDGSLQVNADGSFAFTPPAGISSSYSFKYQIGNGIVTSDATVTISVSSLCTHLEITGVPQAECEALVVLYNSTNGPGWEYSTNWYTVSLVHNWYGVTVANGHVTRLALSNNQLSGSIPDLSALIQLQQLDLSANQLSGSIPTLSALTQLQMLDLSGNQLSGSIPDLSALTQLQQLNLSENQLSGSIPNLSALTQLEYLSLSYNQLNGSIPDLSGLTHLQYLYLHNNQLVSLIPSSILSTNMPYRVDEEGYPLLLCGGSNIITSKDPAVISWVQPRDPSWTQGCGLLLEPMAANDFYAFETAGISVNSPGMLANDALGTPEAGLLAFGAGALGGAVTDHTPGTTISPLPGYSDGSLQVNGDGSFTFTTPAGFSGDYSFEYLIGNGTVISDATVTIHMNSLCTHVGTTGVPQAECEALVALYTSTNGPGWTNSTNWNTATAVSTWYGVTVIGGHVYYLSLSNNQLRGSIPDLSALTQLWRLYLGHNELSGSIPDLSALTRLLELYLDDNKLSGSIPDLSALTRLLSLDLSINQLSGSIADLSALTRLQNLNLYDNQLSGSIPDLSSLTQLKYLNLYDNQLSGNIPDLSALTQLWSLYLDHNQLSGNIPDLSSLTQLKYLLLTDNQLSGSIPDLSALTQLQWLNLDNNQLSGSIPNLSALTQLQSIFLSNNQLSGSIPDLSALTQLEALNLDNNQLSGSIPNLSALTQLVSLKLSGNQLVSLIPPSITVTKVASRDLDLCGGSNIIVSPDPTVVAWVQARESGGFTQGCGLGTVPTATADPSYTTLASTTLTVNAPGVLANDTVGIPAVALSSFGGGTLGGVVTDHVAGTMVSPLPGYSNGSLQVNADGSFAFTPPTDFIGIYTFQYRLDNGVGLSDATVSISDSRFCAQTATTGVPQAECEALVAFYTSTNGPGWTNKANWNTATAVSTWYGVTVSGGHVTGLELGGNQLSGSIPDLSGLIQLANLKLSNNQLVSVIPPSITGTAITNGNLSLCGGSNLITSTDPTVIAWVQARDPGWIQGCGLTAPTATADSAYMTTQNTTLTVNAPGVLANDTIGVPTAALSSFGGGALGGAVTDHAAGITISPLPGYSNGSLRVNADGSFVFSPPTGFSGAYAFQYRLNNGVGTSDAVVSIAVSHFCANTTLTGVPQAECEALVALYTSTNGPGWTTSTNWNTATAVSSWYGVTVDGGHITKIELADLNLTGSIPDLTGLTQLQTLTLISNQLSGSLAELSLPGQLEVLMLGTNQLSGSLAELALPPHLTALSLGYNQLTGTIPDLSSYTQLAVLELSHNQLRGSIPNLSDYPQLVWLMLGGNQLTGNIPDLSANTQLWHLDLSDNQLSGSIPDLSALTKLEYLNLSGNQFVSLVPPSITGTALSLAYDLYLCGGNNIIASNDPGVTIWVRQRDDTWTQGCGLGSAPSAADDPSYATGANISLTVDAPGVLANDTVGIPAVALSSFGGGSLGGAVTTHAAGTTVSPLPDHSDGSLMVNAVGSFAFTPPTDFTGTYTFQYRLDNGVGASDATVTIEVVQAFIVDDVQGFESSAATITFTVTRTDTSGTSTVQYATADGTATAGSDYVAASDTLTFDDGVTTQTIEITLIGDAVVEGDETFFINLSNPTNASIADNQGEGTITNSTVAPKKPANNALIRDNTPVFVWKAVGGAVKYQLQVDNNRDFTSPAFQCAGPATRCTAAVLSDTRYYWHVRARDAAGNWGNWSKPFVVTIDATPPARPVLVAPANNLTTPDSTPFFRWNAVSGAVQYQLQVDDNGDFSSPATNITQAAASYTQPRVLADKRYYWRVRAQDQAGNWSAWSARWSFVVNAIPMAHPTLIPTNTPRPTRVATNTPVPTKTLIPTIVPTATATVIVPLLQVIESDQPIVMQSGVWTAYGEPSASGAMYLLSSASTDSLNLAFIGSEVTVVYIKHPAVGSFAIEVDGAVMQVVDSVATEAAFGAETTISGLVDGEHTVKVYPVAGVVAIDAFRVETALDMIIPTPLPTEVPTDIPAETPIPTDIPTDIPVETLVPTDVPTETSVPTDIPTETPVPTDTPVPTEAPTMTPVPTEVPTEVPAEVLPPAESTEEPAS